MARVPTYDAPQEQLRPLGAPRVDSVATPELLGADARQRAAGFAAMGKAGEGAAAVAAGMFERENADVVFRAETALKDEYLKYEQEVQQKRQGRFAAELTRDTEKWFDERVKHHTGQLKNNQQQRAFAQRSVALRHASLASVSRYEAAQLERSHDEAHTASKNASISIAGQNPTPENVERARAEIEAMNRRQAGRKGWEPEKLKDVNLQDTTALHVNVIKGIALKDPTAAQVYFDKWKHEIDGKRHDEVGKFAKDVSANAIGEQTAEAIWGKHGPKADADPVSLDELEKQARDALKGNEAAMKSAISALRERTQAFDKGVKEREAANASVVAQAAMNPAMPITQIRAMPEFQRLPGTRQAAMVQHIENERYTRGQRARQADEQREADLQRRTSAAYFRYSDPTVLAGMSRNEVMALLPDLGRAQTEHLLAKWEGLQKPSRLHEAKMDQDDFNHIAQTAGLKPFDPRKSEDERAALGELKFRIEQRIDQEQERAKRPLTRAEKMAVFQQEVDNKVIVDRTLWIDQTKPAIMLTPAEMKNAYVVVDNQRVNLSSIPAKDRAEIVEKRQALRLPVTEADIARTWLRVKAKKPAQPNVARGPSAYVPE